MKRALVLSLFLVLSMHAMDTDKSIQVDSEKGIPELYKEDLSFPVSKKPMQKLTNDRRKKIITAALITLLAGVGVAGSTLGAYNAFEPVTHQALPYTSQLPLNNTICTYQEEFAKTSLEQTSIVISAPAYSESCFANQTQIPKEYCACKNPPCKVIMKTCQGNDPIKKEIVNASIGAIVAQLGVWLAYISNVWRNN